MITNEEDTRCCMGNICRSPTGEAVLRKKANQLEVDVIVDSAQGRLAFIKATHQILVQSQQVRNVVTASKLLRHAKS